MSSEWRLTPLPEVIDFQEGPGIMARDFVAEGIPLVRVANLRDGGIDLKDCNFLDPERVARKWSHFQLLAGDLVVSSSGTLGRVATVAPGQDGIIHYTGLIRMRPAGDHVDRRYIRYLISSNIFQEQAHAMSAGSVLQHYGPSHLRQMTVPLPPPEEQRRIAGVLGALDEKIDHDRRLAARLDEFAALLFAQNAADRVDGRIVRLRDVAQVNALKHSARSHPERISYIDISSVRPREITQVADIAYADAPSRARRIVRAGDTIVSTVRPERRSFAFIARASNEVTASTGFAVVSPTEAAATYLYRATTSDVCINHLSAAASGSAYPAVNPEILADYEFVLPADGGAAYDAAARPLEDLRWMLLDEVRHLAEVRDFLIPNLVSGRLRIPESYAPMLDDSAISGIAGRY